MAQKNYLAVVRPAETDLDPVESLLLADLQEGGHTIENDLAEIVRGGKTDYSPNAMSESFKLTIGNVPGDKGIEAVKHAVQTGGQLRIW
ncbi:phage tail protein, partial [Staphylococcus aureus]|nr:phage tail protein [Staphylococcus aureus]